MDRKDVPVTLFILSIVLLAVMAILMLVVCYGSYIVDKTDYRIQILEAEIEPLEKE